MVRFLVIPASLSLFLHSTKAFTFVSNTPDQSTLTLQKSKIPALEHRNINCDVNQAKECLRTNTALFMGRAAAVRAATKGKTDAKKAKNNALYGKKIIMAVKNGGSPDPNANRMLGELIKQAKAASVPMDVSSRILHIKIEIFLFLFILDVICFVEIKNIFAFFK